MTKKIAIIDGDNFDVGLKILFGEEADYFFINKLSHSHDRISYYEKYNFEPVSIDQLINGNFDTIFFIIPFIYLQINKNGKPDVQPEPLDLLLRNYYYHEWIHITHLFNTGVLKTKWLKIIDISEFPQCPILEISNDIIIPLSGYENVMFFKKNMVPERSYHPAVLPFIFINNREHSIMDYIISPLGEQSDKGVAKRLFFSGSFDNRKPLIKSISILLKEKFMIMQKGVIADHYNKLLGRYCFNLDLKSANFPNKRTFDILKYGGGLRIGQLDNTFNWGFEDGDNFAEETLFETAEELAVKINLLIDDESLYNKCLEQQHYICTKYFSTESLKAYLLREDVSYKFPIP